VIKSLGSMFDLCPKEAKEPEAYRAAVHFNLQYDVLADDISSHWSDVSENIGRAFLELTHESTKNQSLLSSAKHNFLNTKTGGLTLNLSTDLTIEAIENYFEDKAPNTCSTLINHKETHLETNYDR
ncbi:hypothetical protein, partial [Vibrio anguillarum]